jgi:hypothetical protein
MGLCLPGPYGQIFRPRQLCVRPDRYNNWAKGPLHGGCRVDDLSRRVAQGVSSPATVCKVRLYLILQIPPRVTSVIRLACTPSHCVGFAPEPSYRSSARAY